MPKTPSPPTSALNEAREIGSVLLGALVLPRLEKGQDAFSKEQLPDWLRRELPGFITRDDDAALFPDLIDGGAAPLPDQT